MPRGLDSAFLTAAAAKPIRPFQTIKAHFDSGNRRFWDGGTTRSLIGGEGTYEGGLMINVSPLQLTSTAGAMRITATVAAHVTTDLAQALAEAFYGRRCELGRGFFAAGTGLVAAHWIFCDGEMRDAIVTQQSDEAVIWQITVEMGTARGRDVVGRRRTAQGQKAWARYLHDDSTYVDTGLRQVAKLRSRPVTWPASGYIPPDMRP